jgi:hypothetical protein
MTPSRHKQDSIHARALTAWTIFAGLMPPIRIKPKRYYDCPACGNPTRGTESVDPRCAKCQRKAAELAKAA